MLCFFPPFFPLFPSWECGGTPVPEQHSMVLSFPRGPWSVLSQQCKGWDSCCSTAAPHRTLTAMQQRCPPCSCLPPALLAEVASRSMLPFWQTFPSTTLIAAQRPPCHQPPLPLSRASSKALGNQAHLRPTALLIWFKEAIKIIWALSEAMVTTRAHRTSAAWCGSPSVRGSQHRFAAEACALRVALPWQHFLCFD